MIDFKSYISEQKNTHMTHIEDQVLYGGVNGAREAILALRSLRDMLAGNAKGSRDVTVKWDGAPAVFCGQDPNDGKFFVAKKGIFNKNPVVYKTNADIDADISNEDLASKMRAALSELKKLGIKGVIQGDIMFTNDDLKTEVIDGEKYTVFHPNTIAYAVPYDSEEAKAIRKAKIGVVFHTSYSGGSFEEMKASYGVKVDSFNKVPSVWAQSATLRDLSGTATLTQKQTSAVTSAISQAGKIFRSIAGTTLREIEQNQELAQTIETYNNTFVRANKPIVNTAKHVEGLIKYITDKYQKEIEKRKTAAGKTAQEKKRDEFLQFFSASNKRNLKLVFDLQQAIVQAKIMIIKQLNNLNSINTFVKKKNGYEVTGVEGFVAIDHMKGGAVKLVDRMEFSTNNFNPDVIKGWESTARY